MAWIREDQHFPIASFLSQPGLKGKVDVYWTFDELVSCELLKTCMSA